MKINKEAGKIGQSRQASQEQMALINRYTKRELAPEEVFIFSLVLCDNALDRDNERFTTEALKQLAPMFVGKTGIFDHEWTSRGQTARIFSTEVITDETKTVVSGESYTCLKAHAYMMKNDANAELINEIDGGIKKEVSVGCAVAKSTCSICGEEISSPKCGHVRGGSYDGQLCYAELSEPTDAFEWSFVAVPAQINAGVTKAFAAKEYKSLKDFAENCGEKNIQQQYELLIMEAEAGREYVRMLKNETVRLGIMSRCGIERKILENIVDKIGKRELEALKAAFEQRLDTMFPPVTQLKPYKEEKEKTKINEFLI